MGASMAINFGFSSKNAHALLVKLNVDENLLKQLEAQGLDAGLEPDRSRSRQGRFLDFALPITVGQMNNLYSGKLSVGELHQLKHGAALLIKAVYQGEGHDTDVSDLDDDVGRAGRRGVGGADRPGGAAASDRPGVQRQELHRQGEGP